MTKLGSVFALLGAAEQAERDGEELRARGDRLIAWGKEARALYATIEIALERGEVSIDVAADGARARLDEMADDDPPAIVSVSGDVPTPRRPRSDKGQKRGPRQPRTSPLTDEKRAELNAALRGGPTTLTVISLAMGIDERTTEGLLAEDPAAFVSWKMRRAGDSDPVVVWGTVEQFDAEIRTIQNPNVPKDARPKWTAEKLGCSVFAAAEAWKRLDPTGPNGVTP